MILEAEDDIEVVGEASDGEQGVVTTRQLRPDVVLMDVQMPTMDGLQATGRISQETNIASRIVILTTFERDDYIFDRCAPVPAGSCSRTRHRKNSSTPSESWPPGTPSSHRQ